MKVIAAWGDLIVSRAITLGSLGLWSYPRWSPSHLALVVKTTPSIERATGEEELWVESSALIPRHCIIQKKQVIGIQAHRVQDRMQDYPAGNVISYRLRQNYALSEAEENYLSQLVFNKYFMGHYDTAPSSLWSLIIKKMLFKDTHTLLCSEFVHDVLIHLGRTNITNPSRSSPGSFLRHHLREGVLITEGPVLTLQ